MTSVILSILVGSFLSVISWIYSVVFSDIKADNIFMTDTPSVEEQVDIKLSDDYLKAATFKLGDLGEGN